MEITKKILWEEKYSVGVEIIDNQHKKIFELINKLLDLLQATPDKEETSKIIESLVQYKKYHFATEEKYFKDFNYEETEDHIAKHKIFSTRLEEIVEKNSNNTSALAFEIIDFLEDWLVEHIMSVDQRYVACFKAHGLK